MKNKIKFYWDVIKETFKTYTDSNVFIESAGLAYFALISIPGFLIIIIWLAGIFFGEEAVRGEITDQIAVAIGSDAADSIQNIIKSAMIDKDNFWMKTLGVLTLVFGATTLFFMLQKSLNHLWGIEPNPKQALLKYVVDRLNSLGIIIVIGFLMTITMILSSIISLFNDFIRYHFGMKTYTIAQVVNFGVGFILMMAIFAILFKVLPDVKIKWRAVITGSFVTAVLFTIGKYLLGLYFSTFNPASAYGTTGTVVLTMMWINYSFLIIFFGAQFTKVNAVKKGYKFKPSDHATWIDDVSAENGA